jgi:ribosomal-protein-alanine N-acetyltransferase
VGFILRNFQTTDFEALWQIDQKCFPPGIAYTKNELNAYISTPGVLTLIAETNQTRVKDSDNQGEQSTSDLILGFTIVHANQRKTGHVITIDVVPGRRRSGIGSRLLAAGEERMRSASCDRVKLETAVDNVAAQKFYERHGYAVVKRIAGYYSNGMDALVLMKDL